MSILFKNALVVDATELGARDGAVYVENGQIRDTAFSGRVPENCQVFDLKGKSLIPGLMRCKRSSEGNHESSSRTME